MGSMCQNRHRNAKPSISQLLAHNATPIRKPELKHCATARDGEEYIAAIVTKDTQRPNGTAVVEHIGTHAQPITTLHHSPPEVSECNLEATEVRYSHSHPHNLIQVQAPILVAVSNVETAPLPTTTPKTKISFHYQTLSKNATINAPSSVCQPHQHTHYLLHTLSTTPTTKTLQRA